MVARPRDRANDGVLARSDVEVRDLPDGCAVLDLETEAVHVLNASAAFVLTLCDGTRTPAQLAVELRDAVPELSTQQASSDVETALVELGKVGLLVAR
jgi:hypothetical protein